MELTDFKIGDKYNLECSHDGRIIWINENTNHIGVSGVRRSCRNCGKKTSGNWTPTVYLIQVNDKKPEKPNVL
jgi:hypothetical protein